MQTSQHDGVALDRHIDDVIGLNAEGLSVLRRDDNTFEVVDPPRHPSSNRSNRNKGSNRTSNRRRRIDTGRVVHGA